MFRLLPELPEGGLERATGWTALTTVCVIVGALAGTLFFNALYGIENKESDVVASVVLAAGMSIPIVGFLTIKIQQLRLANERLHEYATTDSLTGWANRAAFTKRVENILAQGIADSNPTPGAMLVVDIDKFKSINDTLGHQAGDAALRMITGIIRKQLREDDIYGRLGGEEFGVFLIDADPETADDIAERCREAVEDLQFESEGQMKPLTISIGVSNVRGLTSFAALYKDADRKLYKAKQTGRNRVISIMPSEDARSSKSKTARKSSAKRRASDKLVA